MPDRTEEHQATDLFEVTIERILPGGLGLAYADGRAVMVSLAAPGDRLRVRLERVKGSVAFASIVEILEPAPLRIEPPCPYFGRCGGCDFQQLSYHAQLNAKVEIVRDCLRRIAGIEDVPKFEITAAPNEWHYRARAQWQYDSRRRLLGYFEANSHRVCDVAECAVLAPELQSELELLRERMKQGELPDEARYFRAVAGDERVSVAAVGGERRRDTSPTIIDGSPETIRTIHGESYRLNAESFFQTNNDLLPALIDYAVGDVLGRKAIELYCGVGLFTVPLARRFEKVFAVEDDADATEFARENLSAAGLKNTRVEKSKVGDWVARNQSREAFQSVDLLLLDPPRAGVESSAIAVIAKVGPPRICYVSCDPATLARDLKKLIAGGYSIKSMRAFDMFPQTHHVETVVQMTKPRSSLSS
ncbi:MAG TPA: class I SAM-dependent RNA methyltransferase [Pyrinomonadaceae bacterium]|nr:class I SAM-dependent RNA methyltransferase [Pyrinomonadaceae bacterium]